MQRTDKCTSRLGNEELVGGISLTGNRDDCDKSGKVLFETSTPLVKAALGLAFSLLNLAPRRCIFALSRFNLLNVGLFSYHKISILFNNRYSSFSYQISNYGFRDFDGRIASSPYNRNREISCLQTSGDMHRKSKARRQSTCA